MTDRKEQPRTGLMQRAIRPERVMAAGFLAAILIGTLLLALPCAAASGQSIGLGNSLFTATSAVCVTGLVAVDTGTAFSLFGQIVLILLIQLGGLGFMAFATLIMTALGRRITLRSRMLMRESMNTATLSGLVKLTGWYGLMALLIETLGAAVLCIRFIPEYGAARGIYYSIWHAVSAFCNAGFDLFGNFGSLTGFAEDPLVLLTVSALIILGGTGFAVMLEVIGQKGRWRVLSLHARLALTVSAILLAAGTVFIAAAEWNNTATLGAVQGAGNRLANAFFQSVTMRTAGFNSVDLAAMGDGTKLLCTLLMFIGASPASTGGGVKTTTFAVLLLAVAAEIRGSADVTLWKKRLPDGLVRRALTIVVITLAILFAGTLMITLAEAGRYPLADILFEAASAIATTGVSSIGSPNLTWFSRSVLIPMMFFGRIGPLTMALALSNRAAAGKGRIRYPEDSITIG